MSWTEERRKKLESIADLCFAQYNNFEKKTQWEAMLDALGMAYDAALEKAAQVSDEYCKAIGCECQAGVIRDAILALMAND